MMYICMKFLRSMKVCQRLTYLKFLSVVSCVELLNMPVYWELLCVVEPMNMSVPQMFIINDNDYGKVNKSRFLEHSL